MEQDNFNTEVKITQPRGNTRARGFLLTLNEIEKYEELKLYLMHWKSFRYLISAQEIAPTTGHKHIHIYINYSNPITIQIKKACGAHIDVCRGSPKQNIDYVSKDGNIIDEIGDRPHQGRISIKDVIEMTHDERLELPIQYANIAKRIEDEQNLDIDIDDWHKDVEIVYITGQSGIGKTQKAKEIVHEHEKELGRKVNIVKFDGNFWNGVGQAPIAIYDDFRDSHMKPSEFINFIDYNKQVMNIKGSCKKNEYKLIIITSVQDPEDIYKGINDDEPRKQWLRRMRIIRLGNELCEDSNIEI